MKNITIPQIQRVCLIDQALNRLSRPTKQDLINYVKTFSQNGKEYCESSLEKDMFLMKDAYKAPIKYKKMGYAMYPDVSDECHYKGMTGYYHYTDPDYEFWKFFLKYWGLYLEMPEIIRAIVYPENYIEYEPE